ncbi:unnamed protein product [Withania somnifera]
MATKPGILTEWPWAFLGNFKYLLLAPFAGHSIYSFFMGKEESQRDISYIFILLYILMRMVHQQIWISLSRYRTAKGDNRILDKSIEFDQVDRERNWDDQIILNGVVFYIVYLKFSQTHHLPLWRIDGIIITALIHMGPVEFLYYWFHRSLHHHFLYSRYHSHHHSSIVTEPITASIGGYAFYLDFMNLMGHCNFELIPKWMFLHLPSSQVLET